MHPYSSSILLGQNEFWTAVAERVRPLLGDVEVKLGRLWRDTVESSFNRSDFQAIEVARRSGGKRPHWHILQWHAAAASISGDYDSILGGETRAECVAHLVSQCTAEGVWPTSVCYRDDGQTTEFGLLGQPFAVIRAAARPRSVSERMRARIEGTLLGLEKAGSAQRELTRRLARWPGLSTITEGYSSGDEAHWPCPSEWLIASRRLWAAAGYAEVGLGQAQQLATAVFGFKSWNHLCALVPSTESKSIWWAMCAPYYVGEGDSDIPTVAAYQDVADAFLDFQSRVAIACASSKDVSIGYHSSLSGLPGITARGTAEAPTTKSMPSLKPTLAHMHPVEHVSLGEELLDRVRSALEIDDLAGLRALLMIGQSAESRFAQRIRETGMQPLVTDGPWKFLVDVVHPDREGRVLIAELFRPDGTKVGAVTVPIYKSGISWSVKADGFVLTRDYGRSPVAIMRALADPTVQKLRSLLPPAGSRHGAYDETMEEAEESDRAIFGRSDVSDFAFMIKRMTQAGAVLTPDL
ncbi:hypothetical protein R70006_05053 [Paraburkholderia domus]|uniref:hypothetical protein n=1 Tax=Paraburkholderia domus TaxID=2793075 RepID=UPI0019122231|nr:hypothetical protein [Paraburkholderia domus]MBK5051710.1 hypothetical protein [Burkholderia sp. R-70006]CAE6795500.1 hypothetical protein R70006_05053 [Paraburkholderia domus]